MEYKNSYLKLNWMCKEGHVFKMNSTSARAGHWCPKCSIEIIKRKNRKYSVDHMMEIANKYEGKCLSKEFSSIHKKLK